MLKESQRKSEIMSHAIMSKFLSSKLILICSSLLVNPTCPVAGVGGELRVKPDSTI
eukprot:CAMPEP_0175169654 /NCGR_PEP_ID=MMETSP0087-20121206/29732_1 /TAXON_ID=136419 /ORGANISM="Unknown Unknown, Strain D1" /LENGTH=55 /DNA_ID=CAMNT_0016460107 /DNA_START=591 /DNA_END=758 /DNA_ORIENTATION=-